MPNTPQYQFYSLLYEFFNKSLKSSEIAHQLIRIFDEHEGEFFLPRNIFEQSFLKYHNHVDAKTHIHIKKLVCEFAFKDLMRMFESQRVLILFNAWLSACGQEDHLFVYILTPDEGFPFHINIVSNNPIQYLKHRFNIESGMLHIYYEKR